MKVFKSKFDGVFKILPNKFEDHRGFFSETFNKKEFDKYKKIDFVQDNHSLSREKYVFRGLHFQKPPMAQAKLVRVLKGKIIDYVVDIRKTSKTFGKVLKIELSEDSWEQIFVDVGFAHGFLTLEKNTEVLYKVSNYYSPEHDCGISPFDEYLNIDFLNIDLKKIILSDKDKKAPKLKEIDFYFN